MGTCLPLTLATHDQNSGQKKTVKEQFDGRKIL